MSLVLNDPTISVRKLARKIDVNKNTSSSIIRKIKNAYDSNDPFIKDIIKYLEMVKGF